MSCTIDKILTDARTLLERLKEHDTAAESLIDQSAVLHRRVAAMREAGAGCADQGPGPAAEPPDPSRLRPHVVLAQENTQIRDLQQENRELWVSLEEHQDALELIMSKYRKQMLQLLEGRKREEAEPVLKVHQANSGFFIRTGASLTLPMCFFALMCGNSLVLFSELLNSSEGRWCS
ncbi:suppressor of IKBKE 1 isoform X3 [Prinia subflava]|uniref:suppressor of IKBKE 1 isoform X3 n=1 Tax=Prinia subflava TaxID=208062 RepID=UPI002FDFE409